MEKFKEIINITEHPNGEAVVILDDYFFKRMNRSMKRKAITDMCILAREKIMEDLSNTPESELNNRPKASPDTAHEKVVVVLRLLLNEQGDFELLTYFGKSFAEKVSLKDSLIHSAEVLSLIEKQNQS